MPRTPRIIDPQGLYHVISRGNNRLAVFRDEGDYKSYLKVLGATLRRWPMELFHYVLMPNHVHLLLRPNCDLSVSMHFLNLEYSKHFRARHQMTGHVWESRYKSLQIASDAYAIACGNYIEMNPVRAGLVDSPKAWPYSSFKHYVERPDILVTTNPYFKTLGTSVESRRSSYAALVAATRRS